VAFQATWPGFFPRNRAKIPGNERETSGVVEKAQWIVRERAREIE